MKRVALVLLVLLMAAVPGLAKKHQTGIVAGWVVAPQPVKSGQSPYAPVEGAIVQLQQNGEAKYETKSKGNG
ncbi:MAG: hypothetical protein ACYCW6_23825, partial [Candidatus Xenobia bacterium]